MRARWAHAPAALSPGCEDGCHPPQPPTHRGPASRNASSPRWQRKLARGSEGWVLPPLPGPADPRFLTCQVRVMTEPPVGSGTLKLLRLAGWGREGGGQPSEGLPLLRSGQDRLAWLAGLWGSLGES